MASLDPDTEKLLLQVQRELLSHGLLVSAANLGIAIDRIKHGPAPEPPPLRRRRKPITFTNADELFPS